MAAPISIAQAFSLILEKSGSAPAERVLLRESYGCVLAEDVLADRDWPPFRRSAVDGYAVFSADTRTAPDVLEVIEEVPAGKVPARAIAPGQAVKIMTGAPLPAGADCVVMVEQTEIPKPGVVKIRQTLKSGQNLSRRGEDARAGARVIAKGTQIGAAEIGVLAAVGCHQVPVRKPPTVAILGTGNEVVEPHETPGPSQIRNSNSHQLLAQCGAAGFKPATYLGIAKDDPAQTRKLVEAGLEAGLFVSTGGVSVGEHDYVGKTLIDLGVEIVFNKVAVKPGKPTTFGRRGETLVFGLPGNPVAAFVCFHLFVRTAVRVRMGAKDPLPRWLSLPLALNTTKVSPGGDRTTFSPCKLTVHNGQTEVCPIDWHGSGHLAALVGIDGLYVTRPGESPRPGLAVTFYPL